MTTDNVFLPQHSPSRPPLLPAHSAFYETGPERPPSPAPSYHTIAPPTDQTLGHNADPPSAVPAANIFRRAAFITPDAILSSLAICNDTGSSSKVNTDRTLRASTHPDGKERYHVAFPDEQQMRVFRTNSSSGQSLVGIVHISLTNGLKYAFHGTGGTGIDENVVCTFEELQRTQRLSINLCVDGLVQRFYWEFVSVDSTEAEEAASGEGNSIARRRSDRMNPTGVSQSRQDTQTQQLIRLRLINAESGSTWAEYKHDMGKPSIEKSTRWGTVEIKCMAALLDDGMDTAFVALVGLVEVYVRLFGSGRQRARLNGWGILAGVVSCCVM